jgi:hypothetical protein
MAQYIVDGNNLKGYLAGIGQLKSADDGELIGWLRRRQGERRRKRGKGDRMVVWFDAGAGDRRPTGDSSLIVRVAPPNLTADESILREIARLPAVKGKRDATLVTSDRGLREQAIALGVVVVECDRYAGRAVAPPPSEAEASEKARMARELGHSVDDLFVPAQERKARAAAKRPHTRVSPRKVSLLRDPNRLKELLQEGDRTVRRRAALAMAKVETDQGRKLLEQVVVADPIPSVRAAAATALGTIGDRRSLEALQKAAADQFPLVRVAVAAALLEFDDPQASTVLESLQQDSERRVRRAALATSIGRR